MAINPADFDHISKIVREKSAFALDTSMLTQFFVNGICGLVRVVANQI
jgi:hypothetical protein